MQKDTFVKRDRRGEGGSSFFSSYRLTVLQNRSYAERLCKYVFSSLVISVKD